jgi:hypothetical protein
MDPTQPDTFNLTLDDGLPKPAKYAAAAALAYHGYKRNGSILWAFLWSAVGFGVPIIAVPVAIAQGFGKER